MKDEGFKGDRDFLQWDTVSLMSLLGIYVIISYYKEAEKSSRYKNKITDQRFDIDQVKSEIIRLFSYQSDALHWNLEQIDKAGNICKKALESYNNISKKLKVKMHSRESAEKRIVELLKGKESFMMLSRELAQKAQYRESVTIQPKEKLSGTKAMITIKNYLGGNYYFTSDEVEIDKKNIFLIEGKHSKENKLPSIGDIKDGLVKMILFVNLEDVEVDKMNYKHISILKLTSGKNYKMEFATKSEKEIIDLLRKESEVNNFKLLF